MLGMLERAAIMQVKTDEEAVQLALEIEGMNAEVGVYLGILYFLVEICRADEDFGEELSMSRLIIHQTRDDDKTDLKEPLLVSALSGTRPAITCLSVTHYRWVEGKESKGVPSEKGAFKGNAPSHALIHMHIVALTALAARVEDFVGLPRWFERC
jgi:hypothetical protein